MEFMFLSRTSPALDIFYIMKFWKLPQKEEFLDSVRFFGFRVILAAKSSYGVFWGWSLDARFPPTSFSNTEDCHLLVNTQSRTI